MNVDACVHTHDRFFLFLRHSMIHLYRVVYNRFFCAFLFFFYKVHSCLSQPTFTFASLTFLFCVLPLIMASNGGPIICGFIFFAILLCTFSGLYIGYGVELYKENASECSVDTLVLPAVWMIVQGSCLCLILVGFGIYFCISEKVSEQSGIKFFIIFGLLSALFQVAWAIIGGVSLWRDNLKCWNGQAQRAFWGLVILDLCFICPLACAWLFSSRRSN